jgi:hypothetical protein
MSTQVAGASGTYKLGGDLEVNRLGYGTMQLTGAGVWGEPDDRDEALAVLKRTVETGDRHRRLLRAGGRRKPDSRGPPSLP